MSHKKLHPLKAEVFLPTKKFRAMIYVNGRLFAKGSADLAQDHLSFYPIRPKSLDVSLNAKITLWEKKNVPSKLLLFSEIEREMSSKTIWYFRV